MGYSANVEWFSIEGSTSYFCFCKGHKTLRREIHIAKQNTERLSVLIHEINECELTDIFKRFDIEPSPSEICIMNITKKIVEKYPELDLTPCKNVIVTHMLSPYGKSKGNCLMDKNKNRIVW